MNFIPGMGPLSKATSSDKSPVPGHLLRDIAQTTHESLEQCDKVEQYLTKRLTSKNPQVLAKTLRVIKYVAIQGRSEFKRDFQRDAGSIKDLLHFRGPSDPMTGDAPSRTVRETAKEALEAIYSEDTPAAQAATFSSRMKGVGSHAPVAPEPGPGGKAAVMNAVGSAVGNSMRIFGAQGGTGSPSKTVESGVGAMPSSFGRGAGSDSAPPGASGAPDGWSFASNRGAGGWREQSSYAAPRTAADLGASRASQSASRRDSGSSAGRARGSVGGGWGSVTSAGITGAAPAAGSPSTSPAAARIGGSASRSGGGSGIGSGAGRAATDGSYERTLVEEVTAPGGMSMAPPPETLHRFLAACRTLDAGAIVPLLMQRVSDSAQPSQVAAKSLSVIDTMLHDPSLHGYGESFAAPGHVRTLRAAAAHQKAQVRNRAAKLLEVLEDDDASVEGRSRRGSAVQGETLLGFDDGTHEAGGTGGGADGAGGGLDGMFSGLSVEDGAGGGGGGGDSGFSFLQEGSGADPNGGGGGGGGGESGFSFLDQGSGGGGGSDDVLGAAAGGEAGFSFLGDDHGNGGPTAHADDPFSGLAGGDQDSSVPAANSGGGASGFDFLSAGGSGGATQDGGAAATQPADMAPGGMPQGGMGMGSMNQGGMGMGGMPQGSMPMGGMNQGGMGMGGMPQGGMPQGGMGIGGMPQGSMPQGGMGMGGMNQGGMGMGGVPQGGTPQGSMPMGGMPMGGMPMGGMPMGGMPMGGMGGMPQANLGMSGMPQGGMPMGSGPGPATSPIQRSPAKKAPSGKAGKQAAPKKEPDSFDFVQGELLNAHK